MADVFDQFSSLIPEAVAAGVRDLTLKEDDVAWGLMATVPGVPKLGRDTMNALGSTADGYFYEWRILQQRAGMVQGGKFGGDTTLTTGPDTTWPLVTGQGATDLYPDPAYVPMRSYFPCRLSLKRFKGSVTCSKQHIEAEAITTPLENLVANYAEDAIFQLRQSATNQFYGNGAGVVGRMDGAMSGTLSDTASATATIKEGTYRRFVKGQRYQVAAISSFSTAMSSSVTARRGTTETTPSYAPTKLVCVDVDTHSRTVQFMVENGAGTVSAIADGDYIFLADFIDWSNTAATPLAASMATQGVESLLIATGTFPGTALDVTYHRELKSYVEGDETALEDPTPEVIAKMIDYITDSGKEPPPVLIAEQSVRTLYAQLERVAGAEYSVPQGAQFMASGGVGGASFGHFNYGFQWLSSPKIRPGSVLGFAPDTWTKAMGGGNGDIEWFASSSGISGANGPYLPTISGRQYTRVLQAPFDVYLEFGCTDPRRNFRRIGLHSQRTRNS